MNLKLFKKRLNDLYICWKKHKKDLWGSSDVLVIYTPPSNSSSNLCHPISSFFYFWLIGDDFPDTITVFTRDEIHFICNKKNSILQTLAGPAMETVKAQVSIHERVKGAKGDDGLAIMDDIIRGIRVRSSSNSDSHESCPLVVGHILGESPKSKLMWCCINMVKPMEYQSTTVNRGFLKLSKVFNLADRSSGNSKSDGNGREIQMQSLPDDFEERLSLGGEIKLRIEDKLASNAEEKEPVLEKGRSSLEELDDYSLVSEEKDEWVLIEANVREHRNGRKKKGLLGWTK